MTLLSIEERADGAEQVITFEQCGVHLVLMVWGEVAVASWHVAGDDQKFVMVDPGSA